MEAFLENINFQMVYTGIARWVLVALAVYILVRCVVSLVRVSSPAEVWAYLHISRYGLDADGDVDAADAKLLRDYLVRRTASLPDAQAADLNGDGILNAADLAILKSMLLD